MSNLVEGAYLFFAFDDLHAFHGMLIHWSAPLKHILEIERHHSLLPTLSDSILPPSFPQVYLRVDRGVDSQPSCIKQLYHLGLSKTHDCPICTAVRNTVTLPSYIKPT